MKIRKLLAVAAFLSVGVSTLPLVLPAQAATKHPATSQQKSKSRQGAGRNAMEMVARRLNLTEKQKARIKPIVEQSLQRSQKVRADKSLSAEQKRAKTRAIRMETWKKVNPILTKAQRQELAEMLRERGARKTAKAKSAK